MQKARRRTKIPPYQFAFARALVLLFMFHTGQRLPRARINFLARHLIRALPKKIACRIDRANDAVSMGIVHDVLRPHFPDRTPACA